MTYQPTTWLLLSTLENHSFNKSETCVKKDSGLTVVAIGAIDGTELCELVGNFLLHKLFEKYKRKNLAL